MTIILYCFWKTDYIYCFKRFRFIYYKAFCYTYYNIITSHSTKYIRIRKRLKFIQVIKLRPVSDWIIMCKVKVVDISPGIHISYTVCSTIEKSIYVLLVVAIIYNTRWLTSYVHSNFFLNLCITFLEVFDFAQQLIIPLKYLQLHANRSI